MFAVSSASQNARKSHICRLLWVVAEISIGQGVVGGGGTGGGVGESVCFVELFPVGLHNVINRHLFFEAIQFCRLGLYRLGRSRLGEQLSPSGCVEER